LKLPDAPRAKRDSKTETKKDSKGEAKDKPLAKDKSKRPRRPQPLIKLVMRRFKDFDAFCRNILQKL